MKVILLGLFTFLLSWSAAVACGDSVAPEESPPTLQQVRDGAFLSLFGEEDVLHLTTTEVVNGELCRVEKWIDLDQAKARIEVNGDVVAVVSDGLVAEVEGGSYGERPAWEGFSDRDAMLAYSLPHYRLLGMADADDVERVEVEGTPGIRIEIERIGLTVDEADGSNILYLDDEYLPVKIEHLTSGAVTSVTEYERASYLSRESLPVDFYSFDAIRAAVSTP